MININKSLLQKGGSTYSFALKPFYQKYDIIDTDNDLDYIYKPEQAWEKIKIDIENSELTQEKKDYSLRKMLNSLIQISEELGDKWLINNKSPKDEQLRLNSLYLKSLTSDSTATFEELKENFQNIVSNLVQYNSNQQSVKDDINTLTQLAETLNENLTNINSTPTENIDLSKLKLLLQDSISTIANNTNNDNSEIESINLLLKTLDSDLNKIKSTPVEKSKLLDLKKVEAKLTLFRKNLVGNLKEINLRNEKLYEDNAKANKDIANLNDSLLGLNKAIQIGGKLEYNNLDPDNFLEKDPKINRERIPKGKYSNEEFQLVCKGKKWNICEQEKEIKSNKKWILAELSWGWVSQIKQVKELPKDKQQILQNIKVLFKIQRDGNQYTFITGKKAYLVVKKLNDNEYITTKLLDFDNNHYYILNNDDIAYHVMNLDKDEIDTKALKDIFPEIYNVRLTNKQKKEKQNEFNKNQIEIRKLYFDTFIEDIVKPKPMKEEIDESTIKDEDKIYDVNKLIYELPQSNLQAVEQNGNIYYYDKSTNKSIEMNFSNYKHYKVYDLDEHKQFTLFNEEWQIISSGTQASNNKKIENVIIPKDFILIYDYEKNAFIFENIYTGFRYWGIPLLKYSTDSYYLSYSPSYDIIYVLDLDKFNDDDPDNSFVINSFVPDKDLFDLQVSILRIKELNKKDNSKKYQELFNLIKNLETGFLQLQPKINELARKYADNTQVFNIQNKITELQKERDVIESDIKSVSESYDINYTGIQKVN